MLVQKSPPTITAALFLGGQFVISLSNGIKIWLKPDIETKKNLQGVRGLLVDAEVTRICGYLSSDRPEKVTGFSLEFSPSGGGYGSIKCLDEKIYVDILYRPRWRRGQG